MHGYHRTASRGTSHAQPKLYFYNPTVRIKDNSEMPTAALRYAQNEDRTWAIRWGTNISVALFTGMQGRGRLNQGWNNLSHHGGGFSNNLSMYSRNYKMKILNQQVHHHDTGPHNFKGYWDSLSKERQQKYDAETTKLISEGTWSGNTVEVLEIEWKSNYI
ncbi:hypothetical protein K503DRAFT_779680 [Rhizopogon vinicolor AM-OR11-026]|uniref:Uncharacterized protein n=1 Tax=Rhizopogon vinicolor AM-OR11-026 TaxID=1314800 RepID=A0A1B7NDM0_9AGAM|nr:hypothetical protein K503DRAFT_779680 [Rhizopogon vinicolor AM-OR11-026]